jgi:hypothetical protein
MIDPMTDTVLWIMATLGMDLRMLTVITAVVIAAVITLSLLFIRTIEAFTKAVVLTIAATAAASHHHGAAGSWDESLWITRAVAADARQSGPIRKTLKDRSASTAIISR